MENTLSATEEERIQQLETRRNQPGKTEEPAIRKISPLSFVGKLSQHKAILALALVFDILALIPFISVFFNFVFGAILYLYFHVGKNQNSGLVLTRIALPIALGSVVDFFLSIVPVNTGSAIIRIAANK